MANAAAVSMLRDVYIHYRHGTRRSRPLEREEEESIVGGVVTLRYYLTVCWDAFSLQFSERLSGEPDFDPNFFGRLPRSASSSSSTSAFFPTHSSPSPSCSPFSPLVLHLLRRRSRLSLVSLWLSTGSPPGRGCACVLPFCFFLFAHWYPVVCPWRFSADVHGLWALHRRLGVSINLYRCLISLDCPASWSSSVPSPTHAR